MTEIVMYAIADFNKAGHVGYFTHNIGLRVQANNASNTKKMRKNLQ